MRLRMGNFEQNTHLAVQRQKRQPLQCLFARGFCEKNASSHFDVIRSAAGNGDGSSVCEQRAAVVHSDAGRRSSEVCTHSDLIHCD